MFLAEHDEQDATRRDVGRSSGTVMRMLTGAVELWCGCWPEQWNCDVDVDRNSGTVM